MLILLSPAKKLDFNTPVPYESSKTPELLAHTNKLIVELKKWSIDQVAQAMKLSPKLAELNYQRFQNFQLPMSESIERPAILAFNGDVYEGLDAHSLTQQGMELAQHRIRILSGLYGVLRPLDSILPYRLEMGIRLKINQFKSLYEFWGSSITECLQKYIEEQKSPLVVNLASAEYSRSVDFKGLSTTIVHPVFKDKKEEEYKIISFYAKKARGMMARYLCQQNQVNLDYLKAFNGKGYQYCEKLSTQTEPVFLRDMSNNP